MHCPLCSKDPDTGCSLSIWKYNLDAHLSSVHSDSIDDLGKGVLQMKHISTQETEQLSIPLTQVKRWREAFKAPGTSDIEGEESEPGPSTRANKKRRIGRKEGKAHASKKKK